MGSMTTSQRLQAIAGELAGEFVERADVVETLLTAMVAGQHSLMLGPPGTAKSALARAVTARVADARYWEVLLTKFTAPAKLFGPIDVGALAKGQYRQVFDGRATQCEIAFIDEVFKCSTAALNELLAFLNERVYHPEAGGAPIPCPLIGAICASNELPESDELAAIYDRLLVRVEVGYITDPAHFADLLRTAAAPPAPAATRTTVDLADLQHAVEVEVPAVTIPDGLLDLVCQLRAALRRKELVASDRRWRQAMRLVQAAAWFRGATQATDVDLRILTTVLWDSPTQRSTVEREVLDLVEPTAREVMDIEDGLTELEAELDAKDGQARDDVGTWALKEVMPKLKKAGARLAELHKEAGNAGRSTATLDRALARRQALHNRVLVETLGIE